MSEGQYGYGGNIIRVDLSSGQIEMAPTADYATFVGGRGIGAKIYWDEVPPQATAFDPENLLIFATGPLAGFAGFGGSRWQVCGKSPATNPHGFSYCNLGGSWGAALKFAGYDALVVRGQENRPSYLLIDQNGAKLRDARHLWGRGAIETRNIIKSELGTSVNVVACGPPGENKVTMSSLLADGDASGSGGLGAVMGSKMLKAIAIKKEALRPKAARPRELSGLVRHFRRLVGERCRVTNWFERYQPVVDAKVIKNLCWGCPGPCIRISWRADDGTEGKFFCQSAIVYQTRARKYYGDEGDVPFRITKLCDDYGLDTRAVHVAMSWLSRCHHEGIISEEDTGLPFSQEGSMEFAASLLYKISFREGIGEILAQGIEQAAKATGKGAEGYLSELHHKAGQDELYGPRLYIVNGLLWAMDPRQPIQQLHEASTLVEHWVDWVEGREGAYVSSRVVHDVSARFFGSAAAADFTSYEEKALAVKKIQDREFAKESLILCDMLWPVLTSPNTKDHVGDSALESRFLSAVTGQDVDEAGLYRIGEMVFNLQRAILVREGHQGLQSDTLPEFTFEKPLISHFMNPNMLVPGRDGTPVSRMGSVLEKPGFERIRREYYQLRGWDASSGRQTRAGLERLGLSDVADGLQLLSNGRSL